MIGGLISGGLRFGRSLHFLDSRVGVFYFILC